MWGVGEGVGVSAPSHIIKVFIKNIVLDYQCMQMHFALQTTRVKSLILHGISLAVIVV